jgi:hypothetical protein
VRLDWRRVLVYSHRWLGIAGGVLFAAWFASGIVMMYARMPRLTPEERLMRAPALDLLTARTSPLEAARALSRPLDRMRVGMLGSRPVYRFYDGRQWTTVFADTGERLGALDASMAVAIARTFAPEHASTLRHQARVVEPDQWTLQIRALLPAHRIALDDPDHTVLYVSEQSAEVVLKTTRAARTWGYLGAVVHWIYFTPIRRHSGLWVELIIWTSIAGCILTVFGIAWGVWRYSPSSRFRLRRRHAHSPYAGWMRWHHYAGLIFGTATLTWVFSGLLSMNPWDWVPGTAASSQQRGGVSGGPLVLESVTLDELRTALQRLSAVFPVKEIELLRFRGEEYALAYRPPALGSPAPARLGDPGESLASRIPLEHRLVSVADPHAAPFTEFDHASLSSAAAAAMPTTPIEDAVLLHEYDAYYYDRQGALPLPVVRVRYRDAVGTWLYLSPARGEILRKEERRTRINRWIYHGLHSLDFPWLYRQRPLWDVVVIVLSVGGVVVSLSSAPAALRRLRRHLRRARRWAR